MANYGPTPSGTPATLLVLQDHGGSTVRYYNATTSGILAGTPVIQGSLFGVAVVTIAALSGVLIVTTSALLLLMERFTGLSRRLGA